jgi:hypothetical protein
MSEDNEKITAEASEINEGLDKQLQGAIDGLGAEVVKECLDSPNASDCASNRADEAGSNTDKEFAWRTLQKKMTGRPGEQQVREYVNDCLDEEDSPKAERPGPSEASDET